MAGRSQRRRRPRRRRKKSAWPRNDEGHGTVPVSLGSISSSLGRPFPFLADPDERGRRRHLELEARGETIQRDEVRDKIIARDHLDSSRTTAPLAAAADAHVLDTTDMSIDEVVDAIAALVEAAR